jgi:hypothetical protein
MPPASAAATAPPASAGPFALEASSESLRVASVALARADLDLGAALLPRVEDPLVVDPLAGRLLAADLEREVAERDVRLLVAVPEPELLERDLLDALREPFVRDVAVLDRDLLEFACLRDGLLARVPLPLLLLLSAIRASSSPRTPYSPPRDSPRVRCTPVAERQTPLQPQSVRSLTHG